jgi:hypothetical protein
MILKEILRAASFYPNQCKISWLKDLFKINQPNHFGRSLGTLQIQSVATILEHCFFLLLSKSNQILDDGFILPFSTKQSYEPKIVVNHLGI